MSREELQQHDFNDLGITPGLLKRIQDLGFVHPTPIQYKAIPVATSGEDVVGIAQTGSGKTLAFSVPMLQHVAATKTVGLILLPTRELAIQVEETLKKIAGKAGLRTAIIIGGINPYPQIKQLKAKPHIIVATPGRLIDHIEQKHISLSNVGMLVLDEADRMLDMGFEPQLKSILASVPTDRQTMLFSATMPARIADIARQYMKKPLRIEVAKPGTTVDTVQQEVFIVPRDEKVNLLKQLLKENKGTVLIFSRTKHGAKKIAQQIRQMGHTADEIHSNRSQAQRQQALKGFANGKYRILVATDIAARGIDVDNISLVINFDLPEQSEDYVHRIGRTGRAGRTGKAISFAVPEQKGDIAQIQKLINITLPIKSPTGESLASISREAPSGGQRNASKFSRGRGGRNQSQGRRSGGGSQNRRRTKPTRRSKR
ncbi:MAG: DEAD/DEAH box helicase [Patescibacteria group bacterium]|nr:DEAD/DEAH box helicase [Patescibacteria group bacterium]